MVFFGISTGTALCFASGGEGGYYEISSKESVLVSQKSEAAQQWKGQSNGQKTSA